MIYWHYVYKTQYDEASIELKTPDKVFFIRDTGEIYRGTECFTKSVVLYNALSEISVKAFGKLYINKNTLEGNIWDGSSWVTVIAPVVNTIDHSNTKNPVSGKAVADYVEDQIHNKVELSTSIIKDLSYASSTNKITVTRCNDDTKDIELTNVAVDLSYDKDTGKLNVKNASGSIIGTGINLDLERFVQSASYDHSTKNITLNFNSGDPITIYVGDLVDTYTAKNSSTISMNVSNNQFVAEAIVSSTKGNLLKKTDSGLYASIDISGKMDKDTDAVENNIAKFDKNGNAIDSGVKVGLGTIASNPDVVTLATELAVSNVRTALQNSIDGKINKVELGKLGEIIVASADGNVSASGVKIGNATMSKSPNSTTLATEAAVAAYAVAKSDISTKDTLEKNVLNASDSKVVSEKAMVDALSWRTTF